MHTNAPGAAAGHAHRYAHFLLPELRGSPHQWDAFGAGIARATGIVTRRWTRLRRRTACKLAKFANRILSMHDMRIVLQM